MIDALTDFTRNLASTFPQSYVMALATSGVAAGLFYLVFWKLLAKRLQNWRIQIERRADSAQFKRELWNALFTGAVGALLSCIVTYLATLGLTKIYFDISAHHILVALATVPFVLLVDDFWFYWVHRLLHHPRIFRYVHAEHHRSLDVNPFTSMSFHWLEPLLLTFWIIPAAIFVPVYGPALIVVQLYGLWDNIKGHLGYEIYPAWFNKSPLRFMTTSTHHNLHHTKFKGNYGVHFRLWDRLMDTELPQYEAVFDEIQRRKQAAKFP
jgi:Delta7-sterol 5-desaturase